MCVCVLYVYLYVYIYILFNKNSNLGCHDDGMNLLRVFNALWNFDNSVDLSGYLSN